MAKQHVDDLEARLRDALNERAEIESLNAIARSSGIDLGQIYRFSRAERTLRLPAASALAEYLGLELVVKQAANRPQSVAKRVSNAAPSRASSKRSVGTPGAAPPTRGRRDSS